MSLSAEAAEALIKMLQDEGWAIFGVDEATLVRLREHAKILRGMHFGSRSLHTFTTSLEYVAERYNSNDALVHAAIPCLIDFERDESRANAPALWLIDSLVRLMVTKRCQYRGTRC